VSVNETHDPRLRSWVASANDETCDFPIQNLPHGVFRRLGTSEAFRGGVAIGDQILDLPAAVDRGAFRGAARAVAAAAAAPALNGLMTMGASAWRELRAELSRQLRAGSESAGLLAMCLVPQAEAEHAVPAVIGDYTDYLASWHHMVNAGRIFRPDAPPLPQFRRSPIAYHGRSSSVEVSGATFPRPWGQIAAGDASGPQFAPTRCLDYELEIAFWVGPGNRRGEPVRVADAEQHIFGVSLLNDWSARDIQAYESTPLGPFLGKNFLSTISPWVVTLEALEPFRCALPRQPDDPPPAPNLACADLRLGFDLQLEAWIETTRNVSPARLSRSSFRHCYWSMAQMLAHHAEGGCNLRPGDLIGTGTQSGPGDAEQGCLLELSLAGRRPVPMPSGDTRSFLHDGDTIALRAWGARDGAARVGFGNCRGTVLPAIDFPLERSPAAG